MVDYLRATFPSLDFVPMAFTTAKDGRNVHAVLNLARNLHKQASARVTTGELNRIVRHALEANPPPMKQNRRPKVFFATQAGTNPPTIVLMTNGPELFSNTYQRYLLKTFRDLKLFPDVPIRLILRRKGAGSGTQAIDEVSLEDAESVEEAPKPAPRKRERKRNQPEVWDL
jgi:GTP-binding protein